MSGEIRKSPGELHVVLVGLPGAGKTSCGSMLARRLGRPFIDLDEEIERREGRAIREIFAADGEARFRRLETDATEKLALTAPSVISPGGGWIENARNRELVRGASCTVYLRVSPETALSRLGADVATRPLLAGGDALAKLRAILDRREPLFSLADAELDTEVLSPKEVVERLVRLALRWGGPVG